MVEIRLGMKRLTIENWREPDPTITLMVGTGDAWARLFLTPQLATGVPDEVVKLFETARGAIVYGFQFYPLFTLGVEQVFRVMETAVIRKCEMLGLKPCRDNFDERIKTLHEQGHISEANAATLQAIRHLRNDASHPKEQMILTPAAASGLLRGIVDQINSLF